MDIMNKKPHLCQDIYKFAVQAADDVKQRMKHERYPHSFVYTKQLSDPQVQNIMTKYVGHPFTDEVWVRIRATPNVDFGDCLLYTSPSPRDGLLSRMPSSA